MSCWNLSSLELAQRREAQEAARTLLLILTPVITCLGVAANTINIIVLTRRWMASSTNYYLTALAVADVVFLVLFYVITVKLYPGAQHKRWFISSLTIMFPMANLFSNFATWLTCCFTLERWFVVHKPMFSRTYCTKERAKQTIAVIFIITVICTFPNFLEYRMVSSSSANRTVVYSLDKTGAYKWMKKLGYYHVFPVLFIFGPLLFLVVFNSLLVYSVLQAKKNQKRLSAALPTPSFQHLAPSASSRCRLLAMKSGRRSRSQTEQQKITVMLIAVVMLFCLCQLPSAFVTLKKAVEPGPRVCKEAWEFGLSTGVNLLLLLNAASNFVLYSCFSTKFRLTFRRLIFGCGSRRRGHQLQEFNSCFNDLDRTPRASEPNIRMPRANRTGSFLQLPSTDIRRLSF